MYNLCDVLYTKLIQIQLSTWNATAGECSIYVHTTFCTRVQWFVNLLARIDST